MQTRLAIFAALFTPSPRRRVLEVAGLDKALPDAATLLKESSETTKSQSSVHLKLTVQGEIKELPIESLEGDLTNTPAVAAQGKANILFLGQGSRASTSSSPTATCSARSPGGSFQDFGPAADIYDVSAILNPDTGLANVLASFSDPKADGRETINGVDTVGSPARSAPTPSTRSLRRSPPPGPCRARRGSRGRQPRTGAGQAGTDARQQRHR